MARRRPTGDAGVGVGKPERRIARWLAGGADLRLSGQGSQLRKARGASCRGVALTQRAEVVISWSDRQVPIMTSPEPTALTTASIGDRKDQDLCHMPE